MINQNRPMMFICLNEPQDLFHLVCQHRSACNL